MVQHSFKAELKPVFRKGFSTVYRMRIPDEIAESKDVQKTKCIRLKLLKPSLEGRALPQEVFTVKIYGKNVLVPMAIIVSKGLDKLKSPTTVTLEFLGPASHAERMPMPQSNTKPVPESTPRSDARKATPTEGIRDIHVTIRKTAPAPIKADEKSIHDALPPVTNEDTSQLKSEVESIRNELRELNEKVKEHLLAKSTEPPKSVEVTTAKEVIEPKPSTPPILEQVPTQPNQQVPSTVHVEERVVSLVPPKPPTPTSSQLDHSERLISIDRPKEYIVKIEEPQSKPEEAKIRFERDGECVTIYKGKEQLSTVCMQKTVRGILYNCGKCDWTAMEKGRERSGDCEHIQMVKKFLSSSA